MVVEAKMARWEGCVVALRPRVLEGTGENWQEMVVEAKMTRCEGCVVALRPRVLEGTVEYW